MGYRQRSSRALLRLLMPPLLCALWLLPALGFAAFRPAVARAAGAAASQVAASSASHVTVIVLDMSGSMTQNDPQGLRCSAANAYIDLSGPGDFVGVIGLDNATGATGGPHNFQTTVDWGLAPREMATVNARKALRDAIAQKSNGCRPDGNTPTYDALAKALSLLAQATAGGTISGSVILLTDGAPAPDTGGQITAIQNDLIPQFKAHNWPIDAIALGTDSGFHFVLSNIASATSGSFYDDGHGVVPGVSPLNITPFFLDIFRLRNGRSPGPDVPPTALSGGGTARNFSVGAYVSHLDIVVVKDSPGTTVSVLAPNGQRFPPSAAGAFVSTGDPYYAMFAIESPQQGAWELDVSGTGQFLMDSLKQSTLSLALSAPGPGAVAALGEPFTVAARLLSGGAPVSGGQFTISGTVAYAGGSGAAYVQNIQLRDPNGSGTYSTTVTVPAAAPSGSYTVTVNAHAASEDVLSVQTVLRLDLFPSALLISPATAKPTTDAVAASAVGWDPVLRVLYRPPVLSWLGGWPLDGLQSDPAALAHGQVELNGQPYADASVSATATRQGTTAKLPVEVVNDGQGAFHLLFPSDAAGAYAVTFTTTGAYSQSHGDLTHVTRTVLVTVVPATFGQELRAWLITLFYLFLLAFVVLLIRYAFAPKPFGVLAGAEGGMEFARARRSPLARLLHPSAVTSDQMELDPGLAFSFRRGGRILVRGTDRRSGFELGGRPVPAHPVPAGEAELTMTGGDGTSTYTIRADRGDDDGYGDDDGADARPARSGLMPRIRGPRPDTDDDDETDDWTPRRRRRRIGFARRHRGRRGYDDGDSGYDDGGDDDDWAPRRSSRSPRQRNDDVDEYAARRTRGHSRRTHDDEW